MPFTYSDEVPGDNLDNDTFTIATSNMQFFDNDDVCVKIKAKKGYRMLRYNYDTEEWEAVKENQIVVRLQEWVEE